MVYSKYSINAKTKKVRKISTKRVGLICLYVTTTILLLLKIATWLNAEEIFILSNIFIQGNRLVTEQEILDLADTKTETNLFKYDLRKMADRIKQHPYIKSVSVSRRLPDNLIIQVEENEPIALMSRKKKLQFIDERGKTLPNTKKVQIIDYPVISDTKYYSYEYDVILDYLLKCKKQYFILYSQISEISYSKTLGLYFYLIDKATPVILGHGSLDKKSVNLIQVLLILESQDKLSPVKGFDLRYRHQVIVKNG